MLVNITICISLLMLAIAGIFITQTERVATLLNATTEDVELMSILLTCLPVCIAFGVLGIAYI